MDLTSSFCITRLLNFSLALLWKKKIYSHFNDERQRKEKKIAKKRKKYGCYSNFFVDRKWFEWDPESWWSSEKVDTHQKGVKTAIWHLDLFHKEGISSFLYKISKNHSILGISWRSERNPYNVSASVLYTRLRLSQMSFSCTFLGK